MKREEEINRAIRELYELYGRNEITLEGIIRWAINYADAHPQSPWISVEERLPERVEKYQSADVLVRYRRGCNEYYFVTRYDYEYKDWNISNVTHWMPITPLPKGGEK